VLSRAEIVRVAVQVADAEGLDAVSIRRLARELRCGAMSLYHYFAGRDELLEMMGETVAAEMLVPELPGDWRAGLKAIARRRRATFKVHPWMVTPSLLRPAEQASQAVRALGDAGAGIAAAVDDYVIGHALREDDGFEQGLDWLLDGFAARLGR
jgi:AcrR family transcriptional regulator